MSQVLPSVQGPLCAGHPAACEGLILAAERPAPKSYAIRSAVPLAEAIADGVPVAPSATLTGEDSWTDVPLVER